MADNYLEKRFEDLRSPRQKIVRKGGPSLDSLLLRNRSTFGFSRDRAVSMAELRQIVEVNTKIPSSGNRQALRFKAVEDADGSAFLKLCPSLLRPGTEPAGLVLVYGICPEDASLDVDLGISLQSMGLKAAEMGLNCLIVRSFDREAMLSFSGAGGLFPLAVLAVGKSAERIFITPVEDGPLDSFTEDGLRYVPKLSLDRILV